MTTRNAKTIRRLRLAAKARGLCYVCRCRFPRPGVSSCDECMARARRARRVKGSRSWLSEKRRRNRNDLRRKQARLARRLCAYCGRRPHELDCIGCSVCLDERASRATRLALRRRQASLARGLCTHCGKRPREPEHVGCRTCLDERARRARRNYLRRRRARLAAKLCVDCGRRPNERGSSTCRSCLDEHAVRERKRRTKSRSMPPGSAAPTDSAPRAARRCTACGQPGHTRARHRRAGVIAPT